MSYLIFPSATHTRFSHSLGTYETARKFIDNLNVKNLTPKKRKTILAAALLHDIGHGPNSHAFEKYTNISHETYTKAIIGTKDTNIYRILVKNGVNPKDVVAVLDKKNKNE
ncbi:MAG: HD domain-containing protein [Mycoplasmoidaceae bacterium]|nr:HD domain-containing protein [Mycoplasmoidaceae bacterium]